MGGRKRRKVKLLSARVADDKRRTRMNKKAMLEMQTWSDLPLELLHLIFIRLSLEDNIRSSIACKRWNTAAISVRVVNQSPWLMYFPKFGNMYEFYDPAQRKTYSLELPELYGSRVCYTKDGWLLLYRPRTNRVFFFNPFSREVVKLPRFELTYQIVAFSCAPAFSTCVVFTVRHISPTIVAISTCHPGATEWVTVNYQIACLFSESPIIFKLHRSNRFWQEMKTLDGMTLFASFLSSHSRTDLPGMMRNSVYFSKVRFFGKRCISYSLDDCRYYPRKQCHDWGEQDPFENIWIEPPEDLSSFI
ncbi:hypothetical protein OIU85_000645 [Salix viminalis]|uniref:F-box domain-containing protein n=1 Tax=Salix viminalis TaxID=40686 RepID=A0A9Q0VKC5_SALVM|nr:hypothetical protein OIU85_000645 [Salix viminalis]